MVIQTSFAYRVRLTALLSVSIHLVYIAAFPSLGKSDPVVAEDHVITVVAAVAGIVSDVTALVCALKVTDTSP